MSQTDADKWNAIYAAGGHQKNDPARVLKNYAHLLPSSGTALDLACGQGNNAIFLAQHGLQVSAWDISEQAIKLLQEKSMQLQIHIETRICDVVNEQPNEKNYDVIMVSYFLERKIFPAIVRALKREGLLFYQTFIREKVDSIGPKNDGYRLAPNELLKLCRDLHIVLYHEEGQIGDTRHGFRNEVMLIGQRRF